MTAPSTLVVAEKPSVARDIAAVLGATGRGQGFLHGKGYRITWAIGHLVTLAEPQQMNPDWKSWRRNQLPMIPGDWPLVVPPRTRDQYEVVAGLMADPETKGIVVATDAGREGELIFRYIYEKAGCTKPLKRLWISSLTPEAIREGFSKLADGADYEPLSDAAKGRSRADWLVGMNLSRAYTLAFQALGGSAAPAPSPPGAANAKGNGGKNAPQRPPRQEPFSVGRVQTPTLALLVERELGIRNFEPEGYTEVSALFQMPTGDGAGGTPEQGSEHEPERGDADATTKGAAKEGTWRGRYFQEVKNAEGAPERVTRLPMDGEAAKRVAERARRGEATIASLKREQRRSPPPLLYDLTELQRHANRLFGFSATRTLEIAQALYERHKLLSYPRTDSRHLTSDMASKLGAVVQTIRAPYEKKLAQGTGQRPLGRRVINDALVTDHHAILPTTTKAPASMNKTSDEWRIYDLVCRRLLQAWHEDHVTSVTEVVAIVRSQEGSSEEAPDEGTPCEDRFRASGTVIDQVGWKVLDLSRAKRKPKKGNPGLDDKDAVLPAGLAEGQGQRVLDTQVEEKTTRPPRPFTEASILTAMETAGRSLDDKELSEAMRERGLGTPATRAAILETLLRRGYLERQKKALRATDKGIQLIQTVHDDVKSPAMTGEWEYRLKQIERGKEALDPFVTGIEDWLRGVVASVGGKEWRQRLSKASVPPADPKVRAELAKERERARKLRATGYGREATPPEKLTRLLKASFKLPNFREHQREICEEVTRGRDLLLVMPTGAGKSLCYQLPGIARTGTTLVVSPLIALMEDQVKGLKALGLNAERIHSGRDRSSSNQACRDYLAGHLDFLFVAPERLGVPGFGELLARRKLALIAVDEAHCISHWGHDFRPDYRMLMERLELLRLGATEGNSPGDRVPIIGLTATATPRVQDDVAEQLGLQDPARYILGFRRDNLEIEIVDLPVDERVAAVKRALKSKQRRPAIVYAPSRRQTHELADALNQGASDEGALPAVAYHAGLPSAERDRAQTAFISGKAEVIVATIAFGMGIDKADVRTVIHTALPGSVEAYYQEIGRAGRDGKRSRVILLHSWADRRTHAFFHERDYPKVEQLAELFDALDDTPRPRAALRQTVDLDDETFEKAVEKLWIHGGAVVDAEDQVQRGVDAWKKPYVTQRDHRAVQVEQIAALSETTDCRMLALVRHFGDRADSGEPCGLCDICAPERAVAVRYRAPDDAETRELEALLRALRAGGGSQAAGATFRRGFEARMSRDDFESLQRSLARARMIREEHDAFEKDGRVIEFKRLRLADEAESLLDDLPRLRQTLQDQARLPKTFALARAPRTRAVGAKATGGAPRARATQSSYGAMPIDAPEGLVEALTKWRLLEAKRAGLPPFRILADLTLRLIAAAQPEDEAELLQVRGFGARHYRKYGRQLLALLEKESRRE